MLNSEQRINVSLAGVRINTRGGLQLTEELRDKLGRTLESDCVAGDRTWHDRRAPKDCFCGKPRKYLIEKDERDVIFLAQKLRLEHKY